MGACMSGSSIPNPDNYGISPTLGFLPKIEISELPEPFAEWNKLGKSAAELFESKGIRKAVDKMELADYRALANDEERMVALAFLSLIANAYVWEDKENPAKALPSQLAIPLFHIAKALGTKPGVTYVSAWLCNYNFKDPSNHKPDPENIQVLAPFPGGKDWDGILKVINTVEVDSAPGIPAVIDAFSAHAKKDEAALVDALTRLHGALIAMNDRLKDFNTYLTPEGFFHKVLPLLTGWGGAGSPLPDGVAFNGVNCKPQQVVLATAAATPAWQIFDCCLGVVHEKDKMDYHKHLAEHMLSGHRAFIERLRKLPPLREWALNSSAKDIFVKCVDSLTAARTFHMGLVLKFVGKPSMAARNAPENEENPPEGEILKHMQSYRNTTEAAGK